MNAKPENILTESETAEILANDARIFAGDFPREFAHSVWHWYGRAAASPKSAFLYAVIRSRVRRIGKAKKLSVYKIIRGVKYWNEYTIHNTYESEDITQRVFYRLSRMIGKQYRKYDGTMLTKEFSYNWLNNEIRKADRYFYNQASDHPDDRIMRYDPTEGWEDVPFYALSKDDKRSLCYSQTSNLPEHLRYLRVFPAIRIEDTAPEPMIAESVRMPEDATELEQLVIKLLSQGYSMRQIAPRIGRNKNQVETLVRKIRNDATLRDTYQYNDTTYNARYSTVKNPPIRTNRRGAPIGAEYRTVPAQRTQWNHQIRTIRVRNLRVLFGEDRFGQMFGRASEQTANKLVRVGHYPDRSWSI